MKPKKNSNTKRAGVAVDAIVRPINIAMRLARQPVGGLKRIPIEQELLPYVRHNENVDTAALRILADALQPTRHAIGTAVLVHNMTPNPFVAVVVSYDECDSECQRVASGPDSNEEWIVRVRDCVLLSNVRDDRTATRCITD
jgi:hypothetical protein